MGRAPSRPRGRDLHRPSGPRGRRAGRLPSGGGARGARGCAGPAVEWVVRVTGIVRARPEGMANAALATGEIEVAVDRLEMLNRAETPPFLIEDRVEAEEQLRLEYRYLDLRRPEMTNALRLRHEVNRIDPRAHRRARVPRGRDAGPDAATPEGARDFLVPRAAPRVVLRPAAIASAAEAAADGRRPGPLLPDRPMPPRREDACRPRSGVHAARHRDVVRRRGGHRCGDRAAIRSDLSGDPGRRGHRRRSAACPTTRWSTATARTSRTSGTGWSWSTYRPLRGLGVQRRSRRSPRTAADQGALRAGRRGALSGRSSTTGRGREGPEAPRGSCGSWSRMAAALAGREVPERQERCAGCSSAPARAPGTWSASSPTGPTGARRARRAPPGPRRAARPDLEGPLGVRLVLRAAPVRVER